MSVRVLIPGPLRRLVEDASELQLEGHTVIEVIKALETAAPGFRNRLTTDDGGLRRFFKVFVNDDDIARLKGPETPVRDGDVITIVPAAAGG
ncbi:MAG TPA: MoaD/ThiS family protein [bacterium]|nr:MoaD/ThiS family protein [bacterium]